MDHELKIWPQFYARVADGSKTFEVRDADRGFQQGDSVTLREWDPEPVNATDSRTPKGYTASPPLKFLVGYVHILDGLKVIFSLLPLKEKKPRS
jgi:hypothetical protein